MFEIGSSLREARLRHALDLPEVEQATKIRAKYLHALEDEEFDQLPAQTYVKGFLRSYAEYLGLDGQLYVDEFNSRYVVDGDALPPRPRRRAAEAPRRAPRVESKVVVLTLLGIAAVTALVIIAWTRGSPATQAIPGLSTGTTSRTSAPLTPPVRHGPVARLSVTAVRGPVLLLVHRGSVTGPILFQGTIDQGQRRRFVGRRLWVTLDRPENVRIILNHHTRRLPVGAPKTLVITPRAILPGA